MLRGVDLDLPPHAMIRIEGANGTGKSTLLRLLAGIDTPTEGRITGRRPRTAYVPERFPAALPFTAAGYLVHLGRIHGLRTSDAADRAQSWLARLGAAEHARTPLAELSKGTSQKVAVAQALLAEPELLVLDEAWTGLDTAARDELDRAVAERVAAGSTVVFVDHDPRRLAGMVDAAFRVEGHGLFAAPVARAAPGPRVRIEAAGPPGATLPTGLPGTPECTPAADGSVRLTVAATHSDALLRALLTARPPWHIRHLTTAPGASAPGTTVPDPGAVTGAAPTAVAPTPRNRSTPEAP
ncbi:ATP-binding cassette domain-containing protein [Streptomyces sp. NPDC057543]|uniref:ATP-binding cassette domain-containing protein n=1 Tax=Streptomyces sp. NPDC057543 TaxID=3346163 RepID=UPI0036C79048